MTKTWALLLIPLLLVAAGGAIYAKGEDFRSGVFEPPRVAPEFELQGSNDAPLTLRNYRGKVVALAFGFSYCPRICPVTLAKLAEVTKKLGPSAKDLQVVFVTVDPERDSPARLREFLDFFNPAFLGATGDEKKLEAVHQAFGVTAERHVATNPALGYDMHHSTSIYLIDRQGKLRLLVPFGKPADDLLHDVKLLLKE